jgi:hypothetical protein
MEGEEDVEVESTAEGERECQGMAEEVLLLRILMTSS